MKISRFLFSWWLAGLLPLTLILGLAWLLPVLTRGGAFVSAYLGITFIILFAGSQSFVLGRTLGWGHKWLLFTLVGAATSLIATLCGLVSLTSMGLEDPFLTAIVFGLGGAILGLAQWFVLREHVVQSVLWLPVSALLWSSLAPILQHLGDVSEVVARNFVFEGAPELLLLILVSFTAMILSGFGLTWLLRRPKQLFDLLATPQAVMTTGS